MNCLKAEEHFSAYLEDELDYETIKAFEVHLANCESCRHEFPLFRESVSILNRLPRIEPPEDFDSALQMRLAHVKMEVSPLWTRILEAIHSQPVWAVGGLATAVLLMFVSVYLYQDLFVSPPQERIAVIEPMEEPTPTPRSLDRTSQQQRLPSALPRLNLQRSFASPELDETQVRQRTQPRRMERNYILQTVNYTYAPTSGGL